MENELVRYSRAGDAFHYRWAARRCLKMISPKSEVDLIVIEGSKESNRDGEYVIDVAEYSKSKKNNQEEIAYYQLKHTTKKKESPFILSDLEDTIRGFAKRYFALFRKNKASINPPTVTFTVVTNRPINKKLKEQISFIAHITKTAVKNKISLNKRFLATLYKYTKLKGKHLQTFCSLLIFMDNEGDYIDQQYDLRSEVSGLLAGTVDNPQIDTVIALVQERVLPNSDGRIIKEDIYKRLGVSSVRDLFPAPTEFEPIDKLVKREQHSLILEEILNAKKPIIIHAEGGVGKTILARQLTDSLPNGSLGILYDCFGAGSYRRRSEPRHRHRDALVQITNELSVNGLCDPLIALSSVHEDEILRKFLKRLDSAVAAMRSIDEDALVVLFIDAADNAEMAAKEFGQACFAHELLREKIPDGCRLIMLCRTERIDLLQPASYVKKIKLSSFSEDETIKHVQSFIPEVKESEGIELHGLTNGNPRVQANVLSQCSGSILAVLNSLGPYGKTVDEQIAVQLNSAILNIKEQYPVDYQKHIDAICIGLATLPPFVPLYILSAASEIEEYTIKSFVADLGRPLWISDSSVQFRDEPTETWFRQNYAATREQIANFVGRLKPLANKHPYIAETLPSLLLQAENYDELINLALSDEYLPEDSPIDRRNIRSYRLQFAFKAALLQKRYYDAIKLALRAGEESAGNKRQMELFADNIDLIAPLQSENRVQELAFKRQLRGSWDGSENVYSASLLSYVDEFKGEARAFLRAAENWLHLYFEEMKNKKDRDYTKELQESEIVELVFAHFNLYGVIETVNFIQKWRPLELVYNITRRFIHRLVDTGKIDAVLEMSRVDCKNPYLTVAITHELLKVKRLPDIELLKQTLALLGAEESRIKLSGNRDDNTTYSAILSFLEECVVASLPSENILKVIKYYFKIKVPRFVTEKYYSQERKDYIRSIALILFLTNTKPDIDKLFEKEFRDKGKKVQSDQEILEYKAVVGGLLPWYALRLRVLANEEKDVFNGIELAKKESEDARKTRWKQSDFIPSEISKLFFDIITYFNKASNPEILEYFNKYINADASLSISDWLNAVRIAFRLEHLSGIRSQLEQSAFNIISSSVDDRPETKAHWFIELARAVLPVSCEDAKVYFSYAVESVSKYGDEIVQRWKAVVALADHSAKSGETSSEIAYRFIRCAEMVGENVEDEKYWNRNEAIRICARLSSSTAFAAISRWRDRDVGWFSSQISVLATEMISSKKINPSSGWALSTFFEDEDLCDYASLCIENESSNTIKQLIFDAVIRDLRLKDALVDNWKQLEKVAVQHHLESKELESIITFNSQNPSKNDVEENTKSSVSALPINSFVINWKDIFRELDITTSNGISHAIKRYRIASESEHIDSKFWEEVYRSIEERNYIKFLFNLVDIENANLYEIKEALTLIPKYWKQKISVKQKWGNVIFLFSKRFAIELSNYNTLKYLLDNFEWTDELIPFIQRGILEGLTGNYDLVDATTFFGFVKICSSIISHHEAKQLLDYSLERFEIHMNTEFADGNWSNWLVPPNNILIAYTGFLWAALGSPRSEIRWRAAHCIRRLTENACIHELNELITWMKKDKVDVFGSIKFPFYNLHARLYLLIALARISHDRPYLLKNHSELFVDYALNTEHILIEKFSAEIALNLEKKYPHIYEPKIVEKLLNVGSSQIKNKTIVDSSEIIYNQNNDKDIIEKEVKYYHGWDFERYWFEPLGRVFDISTEKVTKLATEVIVSEWGIKHDGGYSNDPRTYIWSSHKYEYETHHSHSNYPRTDDLSFYLSYHAMLVVASRLLKLYPIVKRYEWEENEWLYWLSWHSLTRSDGNWLADRRDPVPLQRPKWLQKDQVDSWSSNIEDLDYLCGILTEKNGDTWLNVYGEWVESEYSREETYSISSALVNPVTSQSLLNALITCEDSNDYIFPLDQDDEEPFESNLFITKRWIYRSNTDKRLDEFDPLAAQINYPPFSLETEISDKLKLTCDTEQRNWYSEDGITSVLISEIWSNGEKSYNEDPSRYGIRTSASLKMLKSLCESFECELIIEISINRRLKHNYSPKVENGTESKSRNSKIFVFSADGKLRDESKNYELRQNLS